MATRDRTTEFLDKRKSEYRGGAELRPSEALQDPLLDYSGGIDTTPISGANVPMHVTFSNEIQSSLSVLTNQIDELTKLQEQRLKIHFNPDMEKMLDRQISEVSTRISSIFSICLEKLRVMKQAANSASSQTEAKIWNNIHRGLSNHLHEQTITYRKIQRHFLEQMKQISQGQSFNATLGAGALNDVEVDTGFSTSQMAELEFAETDVNQRLQDITNIAESVNKLAPIVRELLTLVVDQGTMLDRIDGNMEETLTLVNRGVTEIKKAEEYQKSAYPVKIIVFLMVVITIMVIVIIVRKS